MTKDIPAYYWPWPEQDGYFWGLREGELLTESDIPEDSIVSDLANGDQPPDRETFRDNIRHYGGPLGELAEGPDRRKEILAELDEIDRESIRPLRAVADGMATDEDKNRLVKLEERAEALRQELKNL